MESLVKGLFDFLISIITIITTPIQNIINQTFPDLNIVATYLVPFFNMINIQWIPWLKDISFVPNWTWSLIVSYLVFHFTIAIFTNVIYVAVRWWHSLI